MGTAAPRTKIEAETAAPSPNMYRERKGLAMNGKATEETWPAGHKVFFARGTISTDPPCKEEE